MIVGAWLGVGTTTVFEGWLGGVLITTGRSSCPQAAKASEPSKNRRVARIIPYPFGSFLLRTTPGRANPPPPRRMMELDATWNSHRTDLADVRCGKAG